MSFSRTISPETACETFMTVARSRFATDSKIVPVDAETTFSVLRYG